MKRALKYLRLQAKRTAAAYFGILALTACLILAIAAIGLAIFTVNSQKDSAATVSIGLVGEKSDPMLKAGLRFIRKSDGESLDFNFKSYSTEEKAVLGLQNGEITAYAVIPENFTYSLMTGENEKIRYVMAQSGIGVGDVLTLEVIDVLSNYIVETQAGASALVSFAKEFDLSNQERYELDTAMTLKYLSIAENRDSFTQIYSVGLGGNLSMVGYYVCGLLVFFIMGFGLASCSIMVKTGRSLEKNLFSKGIGTAAQIMGEYLPFLASNMLTVLLVFGLVGVASQFVYIPVPELIKLNFGGFMSLGLKLFPVVLVISAMQFLIYEAVSGVINSVMLQFFTAVVFGYISGCFYPISFFPQAVQSLSGLLPTGVAISYFGNVLSGSSSNAWPCIIYALALLAACCLVRKIQIRAMEGA